MSDPKVAFDAVKNSRKNLIDSPNELQRALRISGRVISLRGALDIWQKGDSRGISKASFLKISEEVAVASTSDFFSAIKDLVVPSESGSCLSVAELRHILLTGKDCLTIPEVEDILATQLNQPHFNLDQFWEENKEVLQKCASVRGGDLVPSSAFGSPRKIFLDAQNALKSTTKRNPYYESTRGCLIFEGPDQIYGHRFEMNLPVDTDLTIMIQSIALPVMTADIDPTKNDVDLDVFLLRDLGESKHRRLTAFTNSVDHQRRFGFQQRVTKGNYTLVPFTSGAWFRGGPAKEILYSNQRNHRKLYTRKGTSTELSSEYTNALEAVFEMADLNGNGKIDRKEFEIFARRSTGDVIRDEDWNVVTGSFPTGDGELTKDGFLQLHKIEANETNDDSAHDLWITLESMGFNSELFLNKTVVYLLQISSSSCQPTITATEIQPVRPIAEKCIIRAAIEGGDSELLEADIVLHKITNGSRFSLVLQNMGNEEQIVDCELKEAENCISSKEFPLQIRLAPKKAEVMAHFVPRDGKLPWKINTTELVK